MNALFETPADLAVPGAVVSFEAGAVFEATVFFGLAAFLATFFGFEAVFDAAIIPLTLDTLLSLVL